MPIVAKESPRKPRSQRRWCFLVWALTLLPLMGFVCTLLVPAKIQVGRWKMSAGLWPINRRSDPVELPGVLGWRHRPVLKIYREAWPESVGWVRPTNGTIYILWFTW